MAETLRIAVTGGSGGVGRFVVRHLLDRGHQVLNLDRRPGDDDRARFVDCDVRQRESLLGVLGDCEVVCHLAEVPNVHSGVPLDEVYWNNTRSASVVLQAAADLGMRHAVYSSSCQVYGCWGENSIGPVRFPIDESHPLQPMNAYAVSKVANEMFAKYISRQDGVSISILRFPWVMTRDFNDTELRGFERIDKPFHDGFETFIHATDLASGFAAAAESSRPGCEIYNLSAADILSCMPLRQRLARHHPHFPALPAAWPDYKSPLVIEKAQNLLSWSPKWSFVGHINEARARGFRQIG
ncbi:MAG: NAD(P)-dependent oxidoreductase [Tepidisphaeraceae bacterium]